MAACGGGGGAGESGATASAAAAGPATASVAGAGTGTATAAAAPAAAVIEKPATRFEAARFLTQASFGPTESEIDRVMAIGYGPWIDEQLALPVRAEASHRAHWEARHAELAATRSGGGAGQDQVLESFWKQALTAPDQLRQRTAFALSQIFVVSMADGTVGNEPRAVADWLDMLGQRGFGTYRDLLQGVSLHPVMGLYLSHLRNQKADPRSGRVPDENFARELMQLFSIGLVELNADGSPRGGGAETYTAADVSGLAKVFTGWSWACPNWPDNSCFFHGSAGGASDPDRAFKPMQGYPQYHSTEEKRFLGVTVPAQSPADPMASLRVALDTLANHANVGPFIGRQLIQRFVTSNPSPTYVRDVAQVFADNGSGVRGDMKAVVKAILMHPEARRISSTSGKLREPVLRLSAFMRAFGHRSDSGHFRVGSTESTAASLGQSPLRAPSVFNFYRPGYVAPGTDSAARGLAAPELQIAHETSVVGTINFMGDIVTSGVGQSNGTLAGVVLNRRDLQPDLMAEFTLASDPAALVDRVLGKLLVTPPNAQLRSDIVDTVTRIPLPAATATNTSQVHAALRTRVSAALLLVLASPEFAVQP